KRCKSRVHFIHKRTKAYRIVKNDPSVVLGVCGLHPDAVPIDLHLEGIPSLLDVNVEALPIDANLVSLRDSPLLLVPGAVQAFEFPVPGHLPKVIHNATAEQIPVIFDPPADMATGGFVKSDDLPLGNI